MLDGDGQAAIFRPSLTATQRWRSAWAKALAWALAIDHE
jgi:hypothetical protein